LSSGDTRLILILLPAETVTWLTPAPPPGIHLPGPL